jgi:signal transduction histidine kinase
MSVFAPQHSDDLPTQDRRDWRPVVLAASLQLLGLALLLAFPAHAVVGVTVACTGFLLGCVQLASHALPALRMQPFAFLGGALVLACALRLLVTRPGSGRFSLLWHVGNSTLVAYAPMLLASLAGLVLLADALRASLRARRTDAPPWQQMTSEHRPARFYGSAITGVALIALAAVWGLGRLSQLSGGDRLLHVLLVLAVSGGAAVVIGIPFAVAFLTGTEHGLANDAAEADRQRFAAHLHDSVLQTLALIQRQAHEPVSVARLARRQEYALRAWMAGQSSLLGDTLAAGLRQAIDEVEDEHALTVEFSAVGDRPVDESAEALISAAREALRNAARHAQVSSVIVFAEVSSEAVSVFVRDEGIGFDSSCVPLARRGLRDAIAGRMAAVGGSATVDSTPGEGTEVALHVGAAPSTR